MAQDLTAEHPCPRCGNPVADGAGFCPTCGFPQTQARREERRIVTVMFGDLSGFTELSEVRDAEEVKSIVDRAFERIADIVERYGGRIDKIIGDEVMAVFGAPQAHEDDAERAVRAALVIQRGLQEDSAELERERGIPLRMHIGINTGEVVAGFVGGSDSYTVIGDVVNTARRIEDVAEPGQIMVGEATYDVTKDAIEYRRIGQVTAKGKRLPVTVYEALAERGLPGERNPRAAPLIGREEELALLDAMARMVRRDGKPLAATIIGEAGMGKSRLAAEFARRISAQGVRVLDGRSLPYGTASPSYAVEEIVRAALLVDADAEPGAKQGWIRQRLSEYGLEHEAERVLALLGAGVAAREGVVHAGTATSGAPGTRPAGPGTTGGSSPAGASPLLEAALAVLQTVALREGLLVVAFHDLHWAEDAVLDFVASLLSSRAPMFAVCLARPDLLERRPQWSAGVGWAMLPMEPLPRDRASEMLDVLAPTLPLAVRENVLDRAGGNPFYLEELARLFLDRGEEAAASIEVPGTVQALVAARLDGLPAPSKRLLQDAAVVGERFWTGALRALGAENVEESLLAPEVGELIEPSIAASLPGEDEYHFRQALVREVAYNSVPKQVRTQQHASVGAWLEEEAHAAGKERELATLIAYQYEQAAVLAREVGGSIPSAEQKAREYLEKAGDEALGMDAAQTASGFFERALRFTEDDSDRLNLRIRLAEALVGNWKHALAEGHLEDVLREARAAGDRRAEGKALRLLGDSFRMRGNTDRARELLERALEIAKAEGDEREEAEGLRSHGLLDLFQGRWSSSTLWFRQALARYRALEDRRGEGWSLQNLGWASMLMGRYEDSIKYLEEGEGVFTELNDEEGVGWCRGMRAWALMQRGDIGQAATIAEEIDHHLRFEHPEYLAGGATFTLGLQQILLAYIETLRAHLARAEALASGVVGEVAVRWGGATVQALGYYPLFVVALLRRDFTSARAQLDQGAGAAETFGDPFYLGLWRFARGWLAFEEGNYTEAERTMTELLGSGELGRIWDRTAGARWLRAQVHRARGRLEEARGLLEERLGSRSIGLISTARSRALLADVMVDLGDARAVEVARAAVEEAGEETLSRSVGLWVLGRALLSSGDAAGAEQAVRSELALLEDSDWEAERIRALALLARALDAQRRHDESAEAFDRARALIEEMAPRSDTAGLQALLLG